jgi:hypothetical protein
LSFGTRLPTNRLCGLYQSLIMVLDVLEEHDVGLVEVIATESEMPDVESGDVAAVRVPFYIPV